MAAEKFLSDQERIDYSLFVDKLSNINEEVATVGKTITNYSTMLEDVFSKIKAVDSIANNTNLLAINASIETIHASDLLASFERIVVDHLRIQGRLIARMITYDPDFVAYQDANAMCKSCGIEELYITDEDGIVVFTNVPAWRHARLASPDILRILKQPELEIALPAVATSNADVKFKTVAVGRKDQRGIIQMSSHFTKPKGQLAINGFSVVAGEAKRLADESKNVSSKISALTDSLKEEIAKLRELADNVSSYVQETLAVAKKSLTDEETPLVDRPEVLRTSTEKLALLDKGLTEIKICFKNVMGPLEMLLNVSKQTNLLGVRAAIEAAHSTNDKQDFDALLSKHMLTETHLASLIVERKPDINCDDMKELCDSCCIGEMWVTDEIGKVELTNIPGGTDFVFKNEGQTAPYMAILSNPSATVTMPPAMRELDGKIFKYAAVTRRDKPGIFQLGIVSKIYGESTAEGFAVVAKQIKTLAEQARSLTTEVEELVELMDLKASRAKDNIRSINKHLSF
ncbi:MAG: hypothetical protein K6F52_02875 [Clostridia bacterium]|nr:hypothetical protein [Clostridia bacterium]